MGAVGDGPGGLVGGEDDAAAGDGRGGELQRGGRQAVGEQLHARAQMQRVDHQAVLVDEVVLDERVGEPGGAVDLQLSPRLPLQLGDGGGDVTLEQGRARPADAGQRGRRDVLGQPVQRSGDRVVGVGDLRPVLGEDLVGRPSEQERVRVPEPADDRRPDLLVPVGELPSAVREPVSGVLLRSARRLHDAVQGDESLQSEPHDDLLGFRGERSYHWDTVPNPISSPPARRVHGRPPEAIATDTGLRRDSVKPAAARSLHRCAR
ncbi:hypothetical protein FRACA_1100006 [Frankia canadensis]|uniref:Uncharacterized protein n=1 Tax=Frankia canadensis TaxID=1836972 RepID=A0A2I2KJB0_9ACTN|nr:hypothetical protein FRACA_1100006 [Frankia canadensis]SOU53043.1 hypothetical protein FRACA_1100006 [Frankia canadensis]